LAIVVSGVLLLAIVLSGVLLLVGSSCSTRE
jgi:hypothetical protein